MDEIKEDVLQVLRIGHKTNYKGEDIERLMFEVESAVTNLEQIHKQ